MSMDLAPHDIDGRIAQAAAHWRSAVRKLRRDPDASRRNVLEGHRAVTTRSMWVELGERGVKDPVLAAARTWVYALTLERVCWSWRVSVFEKLHAQHILVPDLEPGRLSLRTVLDRILCEAEPGRRRDYAIAFENEARHMRSLGIVLAERRAEATTALGARQLKDNTEVPLDPPAALFDIVKRVLELTEPFVPRGHRRWEEVIASGLARDAGEGWPAQLSVRWLAELFGPTGLLKGVGLPAIDLPKPMGAVSFVRALALFGQVYAETDVSPSAPFVFKRSPFDLRVARRAALFGTLPFDPVFGVRVLNLGRARAMDQARQIARALIVTLRMDALRVLLRGQEELSFSAREDRFQQLTEQTMGVPFSPNLEFVLPTSSPLDPTRFLGTLLGVADRRSLIERFDEDWFRSPHAIEAIRAEQAELPLKKDTTLDAQPVFLPFRTTEKEVDAALLDLGRLLAVLFG